MKGRSEITTGSLDMLLDTLCNTFGGVCFIALMVAILSAMLPKETDDAQTEETAVSEQMLVDQEREMLLRRRADLKAALSAFSIPDSEGKDLSPTDWARNLSSNRTARAQLEAERIKLEKALSNAEYNKREVARLERLKAELEKQTREFAGKVRRVRMPIERELPGLRPVNLWLRDGRLYLLDNNSQVRARETQRDGERCRVCSIIPGTGYRVDEDFMQGSVWQNLYGRIRGNVYARIYSDAKSFPQLCKLRDQFASSRKMYNWYPLEDTELVFVAGYDGKVQ